MPQRKPVHGTAKLFLTISVKNSKGKEVKALYELRYVEPGDGANPIWRLKTTGGSSYDVALEPTGASCTCPDWTFCRANEERGCKHCESLRAVGLLRPERNP